MISTPCRPLKLRSRLALFALLIMPFCVPLRAIAQSTSPVAGSTIDNQALGSFTDIDNSTKQIESNTVTLTVAEVAGITFVASGNSGTPNPGNTIYFDFTVTNTGNDPTQFRIPDTATLVGGTLSGIEIISYDLDGSAGATLPIAVNKTVPSGGIDTGAVGAINLPNGAIFPLGTVLIRVGLIQRCLQN
jgi:hypothetical protein